MKESEEKLRQQFAVRLIQALAHAGIEGSGRGKKLAAIGGVGAKAASKWLNAETMPTPDKVQTIAKKLKVDRLWLERGEGLMLGYDQSTKRVLALMDALEQADRDSLADFVHSFVKLGKH